MEGPLWKAEPEYLKGIFLNGLKDFVKAELKLRPVTSDRRNRHIHFRRSGRFQQSSSFYV
ncbi:hypothetical protein QQ045_011234 [Rhodiola kirilowii]